MTNIIIRDAQLIFKNFSGAPDKFNRDGGNRKFSVRLNEADAEHFRNSGWNVKPLKGHPDDEEQWYHVSVKVNYGSARPPKVTLLGMSDGVEISRTILNEDTIGILDASFITGADIEVNEYRWTTPSGDEAISLYLNNAYISVEMSPLDVEYAQSPDSPF